MRFFVFFLLAFSNTTFAVEDNKGCKGVSKVAELIMINRQSGVAMSRQMAIAKGEAKSIIEGLIVEAYELPRYGTDVFKKRSIENFRDKYFLQCFKSKKKQR